MGKHTSLTSQKPWYTQTESEVCAFFDVDKERGLSKKDTLTRLARFGVNRDIKLPEALQKLLTVTVLREAKQQQIAFNQVALGDIVVVRAGNRVPADIRLLKVSGLTVNQNQLTGEVLPAAKNTFGLTELAKPIAQKCMLFAGSYVESGIGMGIVVARGADTQLAKSPASKKSRIKPTIKGSVIARRLRRFGIVVLNQRALADFRRINTVIIAAPCSDATIVELIRKVQLTRNIDCKFVVSPSQADRLSKELSAQVYNAATKNTDIFDAQFITHLDEVNSLDIARMLTHHARKVLWLSDGTTRIRAMAMATISMVVGQGGRDDIILSADIVGSRVSPLILTRILYNKK